MSSPDIHDAQFFESSAPLQQMLEGPWRSAETDDEYADPSQPVVYEFNEVACLEVIYGKNNVRFDTTAYEAEHGLAGTLEVAAFTLAKEVLINSQAGRGHVTDDGQDMTGKLKLSDIKPIPGLLLISPDGDAEASLLADDEDIELID